MHHNPLSSPPSGDRERPAFAVLLLLRWLAQVVCAPKRVVRVAGGEGVEAVEREGLGLQRTSIKTSINEREREGGGGRIGE